MPRKKAPTLGRPAESEDGNARDVELRVRLSPLEMRRVQARAKALKLSVSDYVRGQVFAEDHPDIDVADAGDGYG